MHKKKSDSIGFIYERKKPPREEGRAIKNRRYIVCVCWVQCTRRGTTQHESCCCCYYCCLDTQYKEGTVESYNEKRKSQKKIEKKIKEKKRDEISSTNL
jgi:hypothetical protein